MFDQDGNPTKMALGFTKKIGISLPSREDLLQAPEGSPYFVVEAGGKAFVHTCVETKAQSALSLIQKEMPALIKNIDFPKKNALGRL